MEDTGAILHRVVSKGFFDLLIFELKPEEHEENCGDIRDLYSRKREQLF